MAENIFIESNLTDEEKYIQLRKQLKSLISRDDNFISSLANVSAVLKQVFEKISWVGFYILEDNHLYLGPFQGKVACTKIEMGKGVCGTAAEKMQTVIVPDVDKFPGHIVCDSDSKSEIVVPLMKNNKVYGVLDLDSYLLNAFDETDRKNLEEIADFLSKEIL